MKEPNGHNVATPISTYQAKHIKSGAGGGNIKCNQKPASTPDIVALLGKSKATHRSETGKHSAPLKARIKS